MQKEYYKPLIFNVDQLYVNQCIETSLLQSRNPAQYFESCWTYNIAPKGNNLFKIYGISFHFLIYTWSWSICLASFGSYTVIPADVRVLHVLTQIFEQLLQRHLRGFVHSVI